MGGWSSWFGGGFASTSIDKRLTPRSGCKGPGSLADGRWESASMRSSGEAAREVRQFVEVAQCVWFRLGREQEGDLVDLGVGVAGQRSLIPSCAKNRERHVGAAVVRQPETHPTQLFGRSGCLGEPAVTESA